MRRARAIVARLPRPTHPALVAATALITLLGLAALALLVFSDWDENGNCSPTDQGLGTPACEATPRSEPLATLGATPVTLVWLLSWAWFSAHVFWLFARWLHHRPGPRGLPGSPTGPALDTSRRARR